ncbi:transmembrane signal receptor [Lithospermum erythrorhizon]|uniref:non-specific serine/threonine protein kinase n=1 Tax=Lithospermum erythrorhizon TaxID=34254 RepID=A0AAV3Q4P8_LITER
MSSSLAAVVGGVGAGLIFLVIIIVLLWFCIKRIKMLSNKNSESGSSDPSAGVELRTRGSRSSTGASRGGRQFSMQELEQATKQFNENNLIGCGSFGLVYKGFLSDGTVVAIKRRTGPPKQEFVEEVGYFSRIRHRNLVSLLGYCQESGYQLLVSEYLPNGSMCNHLYETEKQSISKLEFRQRLSIAIGAARGLYHLHSQQPPIMHGNFRTANVMVDENFIAKVADAGLKRLLEKIEVAGPSQSSSINVFSDPEIGYLNIFSEANDVFSFGIFLLELLTGKVAPQDDVFVSNESILLWLETHLNSDNLVDHRLIGSFTTEGMQDLLRLTIRCVHFPGRERPTMTVVVSELDDILEKEFMRTTVVGEGTTIVTLGSQLFTT